MTSDLELLRDYAMKQSEEAFASLVSRYVDIVYSAALRSVQSPQLAEEVSQSVFTDLARSAHRLDPDTLLGAWLYQVARRTAIDVVRRESRRQHRESIASELDSMQADTTEWNQIEPLLDDAMGSLSNTDRAAVVLRFFENKSFREVGLSLGTSEDTAQKRVSRALERLRLLSAREYTKPAKPPSCGAKISFFSKSRHPYPKNWIACGGSGTVPRTAWLLWLTRSGGFEGTTRT